MRVIFQDRCWVVHIPFVCMVKFKFLAHLPVDHFADPIMSSHIPSVLICCTCLLCDWWFHLCHHSQHLLFCGVLSIFALIWLVLTALSRAAIRRDSVSLLRFPFLSHVQVLSCEMLVISRLNRPKSCFPSHFCFLVIVILLSIVLSVSFLIRVFHISVSWWSFTGVWVTASLLKSPGLFSEFWPLSVLLQFGWSPLVRQLPNPPVPLIII